MAHVVRPVYHALYKPLTILGVERKLFFVIVMLAVAIFNIFDALIPAIVIFLALWSAARSATRFDPHILRIVVNSSRFAVRYDPAKWSSAAGTEGFHSARSEKAN